MSSDEGTFKQDIRAINPSTPDPYAGIVPTDPEVSDMVTVQDIGSVRGCDFPGVCQGAKDSSFVGVSADLNLHPKFFIYCL